MPIKKDDPEFKRIVKATMDQYKRSGLFDAVRKEVVGEIMTNDFLKKQIYADCESMIRTVLDTNNPSNSARGLANQRLKYHMALRPVRRNRSIGDEVKKKIASSLEAHSHIEDVERLVRKTMGLPEKQKVVVCDPPPPPAPPVLEPLEDGPFCEVPPPPPPPAFPKFDFDDEPCSLGSIPIEDSFESVDDTLEDSQEEVLMEVSDGEEEWAEEETPQNTEGTLDVAKSNPVVESVVPVSENDPMNVVEQTGISGRSRRQPKKRTDSTYVYY